MHIAIVGAGLGGLTAARALHRVGIAVSVFESGDRVGGRVRTDIVHGFLLDRGFQILLTSYPAAMRQLELDALDLRRFDPGAIVAFAADRHILADPFRDPLALPATVRSPLVSLEDKLRTLLLAPEEGDADETTETLLLRSGLSGAYIDRFVRPFFGGIFLDRSLRTSARAFRFLWNALASGYATVPAHGMGAIAEQLAAELIAAGRVRFSTTVEKLTTSASGAVDGVVLASGEKILADAVIVAAPAPEASRLTGEPMPEGAVGATCLYFSGPMSVYSGRKLVLHANPGAFINNVVQIDNIAPEYAPPGQHLISATVIGVPDGDDATLYTAAIRDLRRMWAGDRAALDAIGRLAPLALYRIPYAQFAQPAGIYDRLPGSTGAKPGLYFAGEFTEASSIQGALLSGEECAAAILRANRRTD